MWHIDDGFDWAIVIGCLVTAALVIAWIMTHTVHLYPLGF